MSPKILTREKFTSVQQVQSGVTKLLQSAEAQGSYYRVMRNNEPLGVLLTNDTWEDILEDMEAMSSPNFLKSIEEARRSKVFYTPEQVKKMFDLS